MSDLDLEVDDELGDLGPKIEARGADAKVVLPKPGKR